MFPENAQQKKAALLRPCNQLQLCGFLFSFRNRQFATMIVPGKITVESSANNLIPIRSYAFKVEVLITLSMKLCDGNQNRKRVRESKLHKRAFKLKRCKKCIFFWRKTAVFFRIV